MLDHRIENSEELAHASDQSNFEQFALSSQPFVEVSNHRIACGGDQGRHIQRAAHGRSTTPDGTAAFERTTVSIERCDTSERSNLFTIESAEFRQFGEQGAARDWADSWDSAHAVFTVFPDRVVRDGSVEFLIDSLQCLFEDANVLIDAFCDGQGSHLKPIDLGADGFDEISSACGQAAQLQGDGVRQGAQGWTNDLSEVRQHASIEGVGLSQLAGGLSEVSNLSWVDHDGRQFGAYQRAHGEPFIATGGFEHDQGGLELSQPFDQGLDADFIIGKRLFLAGGANRDIELSLGHVDTDEDLGTFQNVILLDDLTTLQHNSTLRKMRAWLALATVRAFWEPGRDGPCYITVSTDRGAYGLSHPVSY